jgi:hypothetical protein
MRADYDGSNPEQVKNVSGGSSYDVVYAVDPAAGKVYWGEIGVGAQKVFRSNLDGTNTETIIFSMVSVEFDFIDGKVYWSNTYFDLMAGGDVAKIYRANLDGTNQETLLTRSVSNATKLFSFIQVNEQNNKVYFAGNTTGSEKIERMDKNGTNLEDVAAGGVNFAFVVSLSKIYWTRQGVTDDLNRANLDGSSSELGITTGFDEPYLPQVDTENNKILWLYGNGSPKSIARADYDGSNSATIITNVDNDYKVLIDSTP